ncbi:phage tail protein [Flavobacterium sp. 3HN19-14]|uniref:phage tail protein n=1 Tax=Flavobacterium sp. 3HN19-14 TaxID=3448133 RepID=UPI003EE0A2EB
MDDQYLGQIMLVAGTYAPAGYAECNGQLLQIAQHRSLFGLLKNTYGGDGVNTFAIPDLRGRIPCGIGKSNSGETIKIGEKIGSETNTLTSDTMPAHTHKSTVNISLNVSATDDADSESPVNNYLRIQERNTYATTREDNDNMARVVVTVMLDMQGSATPMPNIMPSLPMIYCISLEGQVPSPEF